MSRFAEQKQEPQDAEVPSSAPQSQEGEEARGERAILPSAENYVPPPNRYVAERLHSTLNEYADAVNLEVLAKAGDDEAFDAEIARRASVIEDELKAEEEAKKRAD